MRKYRKPRRVCRGAVAHLYDLAKVEGAKHNKPPSRQFQLALIGKIARLLIGVPLQSPSLADPDIGKAAERFLREVALPHLAKVEICEEERVQVLRVLSWRLSEKPTAPSPEVRLDLGATQAVGPRDPNATLIAHRA